MINKKTHEIINLLTKAVNTKNQELINIYAYELATRLYVPGVGMNFDDLCEGFGYRKTDKINPNQISMEEYMKEVENNDDCRKRRKNY